MKDARSRADRDRIRAAVAAESAAWEGATERRADAEYTLEQFEESSEFAASSERFDALAKAVHKAREEERAANRAWRETVEHAERDLV